MNSADSLESEDFFVTAAGRRLAARWLRPARRPAAEGPVLVFLHEGLGSIAQWRDFPIALVEATGLPALVYERWGFGRSEPLTLPRPSDYLQREAEEALPEVLAACGIERPVLIGHSDGGSIVLIYAAAFPERPAACITEAAHVFVEDVTLQGIRDAARAWETTDLRERLAKYHGAGTERVFRGWTETWLRADFRDWDITDRLADIVCPLLVIQGADDEYGTPAQVEAIAAGVSGPAEPLIVPDCGHIPHLQQGMAVLEAMAAFLQASVALSHDTQTRP